jgi:chloramphenicol 3-O phosphotransferase
MTRGNIIFLNGTSSSGKAAIISVLQDRLPEPYLRLSVDEFLHLLPARYFLDPDEELRDDLETSLIELYPRLMSGLHHSMAALASQGVNLLVDHILQVQDWLEECVVLLSNYPVLFVGVRCDLEEAARREREEKRVEGLALLQSDVVHTHGIYDVEVDTCQLSSNACAQVIQETLQKGWAPNAFHRIRENLAAGTLWD